MPRNVSDIYYILPGTWGFPDTTIESEKYNNYIDDVAEDLNRPRPIVAGGTGADDADEALANLGAEKAGQKVDNFDSHVWVAGSFYSTISATAPPVALHAFSGIVHLTDANNMVVHAVDLTDPFHTPWSRVKTAGVWGEWIRGNSYSSIISADDPPASVPDNTLWFESTTGLLYIRYNDGDSIQWTIACPQPDISTYAIKEDVADETNDLHNDIANLENSKVAKIGDTMEGTLLLPDAPPTLALQAVNKQYVDDRTAVSAFAYDGMQINGAMEVSQEYGESAVTISAVTNKYIVDGWRAQTNGAQVVVCQQNSSIAPMGFSAAMSIAVSTPNTAPAAGNYCTFTHRIEGCRIMRLSWGTSNAQPIVLSFWVYAIRPGSYSGSINNNDLTRSYTFSFTVNSASTWEYKVINIPGAETGTWVRDNGVGMVLNFTMMAGSNFTTAAGSWVGGNYLGAPGTINGIAAVTDAMLITGLTVIPGTVAPSAEQSALAMRPFDQELVVCQRHYQKTYDYGTVFGTSGAVPGAKSGIAAAAHAITSGFYFITPMRAVPSILPIAYSGNGGRWSDGLTNADTPDVVTVIGASENGFDYLLTTGLTVGRFYWGHWTADARL